MRSWSPRASLALIASLWLAAPAAAEGWRTVVKLQGRNERLGVGFVLDQGFRIPLSSSENLLLRGTYVEAGAMTTGSPAAVGPGLYVQAVPIAPILLRAQLQRQIGFGLVTALQAFDGPDADWSPGALDDLQGQGRIGEGLQATLQGTVRLKVGPVFALFDNLLMYTRAEGIEPGQTWYHATTDLLVDRGDFVHAMKSTLGYAIAGDPQGEVIAVAAHHERYGVVDLDYARQIVGGILIWRPSATAWGRPLIYALAGAIVEDPYKAGDFYLGSQIVFEFDHGVE